MAAAEETNHVLEYEKSLTDENDESEIEEFSVPDVYFSTNAITIAHCSLKEMFFNKYYLKKSDNFSFYFLIIILFFYFCLYF